MQVSIFEIARRQFTADAAIHTSDILPFALQRLFQGREMTFELGAKPVSLTVLQWAFTCGNPKEFFPGRFSLVPVKRPADTPLAQCCLKQVTALYPHDLFQEERHCFSALWGDFTGQCDLLPVTDISLETTKSRSNLWLWRARLPKETLRYDSQHDLLLAAILTSSSASTSASRDALAQSLLAIVKGCVELFSGSAAGAESLPSVCMVLPHGDALVTWRASEWAELGNPAVDRLVEACWTRRSLTPKSKVDENDFALSTLVIRRCGEPLSENEAYARFSFGRRQWVELERRATKEFEQRVDAVAKAALKLSDWLKEVLPNAGAQRLWQPTMEGLERLGFSEPATRSPEDLRAQLLGRRDGFPTAKAFAEGVRTAFRRSFRMSAVVSNRVMNSCLCELVGALWSSPGLLKTLKDYPRDTLICEMAFFPEAVGRDLFYVPLMLPASRRSATKENAYFLSYAVGMCPPELVRQDTFREIAENFTEDLYMSFLEEAYGELAVACESARTCQNHLAGHVVGQARTALCNAKNSYDQAALDLLRLADFHVSRDVLEYCQIGAWDLTRVALRKDSALTLVHRVPLVRFEQLADHIFGSAIAEMKYHSLLISKHLGNVEHSGLLDDLVGAVSELRELRTNKSDGKTEQAVDASAIAERLRSVEQEIEIAQSRWALLIGRHDGTFQNDLPVIDAASCVEHFRKAVKAVRKAYGDRIDFDQCPPQLTFVGMHGHAIRERPGVLREVFINLLSNRVKHERTKILEVRSWGVELSWAEEGEITKMAEPIPASYERWRECLRQPGGACLIRAHPCSLPQDKLRLLVQEALWGTDLKTQGIFGMTMFTKVYDRVFETKSLDEDPIVPIATCPDGPNSGMLMLMPGR